LIFVTLRKSNVPVLLMQNLREIIEALGKTLDVNHRSVLNAITSKFPLASEAPQIDVIDDEMNEESEADGALRRYRDDQPTELEQELKLVGYLLSAQRMAAEILSNICTPDDDNGLEDIDDKSDAESVQDYETGAQLMQNNLSADKIPIEVAEAIKANQIVEKVLKTSNFTFVLSFIFFRFGLALNFFLKMSSKYWRRMKRLCISAKFHCECHRFCVYTTFAIP
jgi:hypothetical protein